MEDEDVKRLAGIRERFSEWLGGQSFAWDSFGTFTFSKPVRRGAIPRFDAVLRHVGLRCPGESQHAFIAEERGPSGGRIHLHALLEHPGVLCDSIKREWSSRYGFATVKKFNPQLGAVHYVTKYIIKDSCGLGDWALKSTCDSKPDTDLFQSSIRRTGYQLYTTWVHMNRNRG